MNSKNKDSFAITAKELAKMLTVSLRHIRRLDSAGKLPRPVRIGRCVRWPKDEICRWIEAGTPNRKKWEIIRKQQGRNN